jgi:transposase-like protein
MLPDRERRIRTLEAMLALLLATGVNADGHREILGLQVNTGEDGAGWLGFFRDLTARGLTGVQLVTSDAHNGLVSAIGATLPGAAWQRCRTHYAANLMSVTPKASWPCPVPGENYLYSSIKGARSTPGRWPGCKLAFHPGPHVSHR